jgi:diguanylate cyclase (GGDEF)-like protein/PAS domain S-box-containing protein/putative nucleotidyltransferase with HDIG domain
MWQIRDGQSAPSRRGNLQESAPFSDRQQATSIMANHAEPSPVGQPIVPADEKNVPLGVQDTAQQASNIAALLESLDEAAAESGQSSSRSRGIVYENKLIHARLGVASGLYAALRCKHAPTASHSLRVALGCSSWADVMELDPEQRDALEVAALLHDVGKIGVPDHVLLKPGRLLPEEMELMDRHGTLTVEILSACGVPESILEIVHYARNWYDGVTSGSDRKRDEIPLVARMLSIVDAFDSMTIDHVYRPARSRERALAELFRCAGTQFDPQLVQSFSGLFARDQNLLAEKLARHWLHRLQDPSVSLPWQPTTYEVEERASASPTSLFEKKLIDNTHDGVMFVDGASKILLWNTGAERLTGVSSVAACGRKLVPSLVDMYNSRHYRIPDDECPVERAIESGVQWMGRVSIMGRQGHPVYADLHVIPVRRNDGAIQGATVLLHDVSSETSLEEKCQALHVQVAKDPMTQVANRAEFDRMLDSFVAAHQESERPCALIMADIDYFKTINDSYGHQAGDEAIITFASLLKSLCRSGDLVARYGGEEFAILCADCTNASAALKAEVLRKALAAVEHSALGNRSLTASFGVTELQPGDTPETMLRRSDRALLMAKDQGRNQVCQLGDGMTQETVKKGWWPFRPWRGTALVEATLVTAVPMQVAIEKLRGFISDQGAKITQTGENKISLEVADQSSGHNRRKEDRPIAFSIALEFSQKHFERSNTQGFASGTYVETRAKVCIQPCRDRDRRREATVEKARRLLGSLKSYLMAKEDDGRPFEPAEELASAIPKD